MTRATLSIFSSRILRSAGFWMIIMIAAIELTASVLLPPRFFSHPVDRLLYNVEHRRYNAKTLILGDSLARQLFWADPFGDKSGDATVNPKAAAQDIAVLTANAAIEMTGQYFLIRRYLERNDPPQLIIYYGRDRDAVRGNLSGPHVENYVQRCFLRFDEISELTVRKGARFGLVMLVYKLLPTFRYRLHLQEQLTGFTNAEIFTGAVLDENLEPAATGHSLLELPVFTPEPRAFNLAKIYFEKTIRHMDDRGINFYYVRAPLPESESSVPAKRQAHLYISQYFAGMQREHQRFSFEKNLAVYPDTLFKSDHIHLTPEGVEHAIQDFNR